MDKIVFLGDLERNLEDVLSVIFLHKLGMLDYCVLGEPYSEFGIEKYQFLLEMGIDIRFNFGNSPKWVVAGGSYRKIVELLDLGGSIENLVICGGFVGSNILRRYGHNTSLDTLGGTNDRFNYDIESVFRILHKDTACRIKKITCIGGNVTNSSFYSHAFMGMVESNFSGLNTKFIPKGVYVDSVMACYEVVSELRGYKKLFNYALVYPVCFDCRWGSEVYGGNTPFRLVYSALQWL